MDKAKDWTFDREWTRNFTALRQQFVRDLLAGLRDQVRLESAIDVGCGVGDFSKFLSDLGLRVLAVDGRESNVAEAKSRYPHIEFLATDAESIHSEEMGKFDLVLCFGLLYHLENPFRVVRHLRNLTSQILLVETACVPDSAPSMMLLDEGVAEDQGLNYVAFYPSQSCVIKMLYRAGFPFVYRFKRLPHDKLYESTVWEKQQRTLLMASNVALHTPNAVLECEPIYPVRAEIDAWSTRLRKVRVVLGRFKNRLLKQRPATSAF